MAQNNSGTTNSASYNKTTNKKVGYVKSDAPKNNPALATIREQYEQEQKKQKANYAKAADEKVKKTLRDLAQSTGAVGSLTSINRDTIRGYLTGNIYANSTGLINASRYLFYRSPIYAKMCYLYADMYQLNCRKVTPTYDFTKGLDGTKALKQYETTLRFLDTLNLQATMNGPLLNMWVEDVSFNLFFHDDYGSLFYRIDPSEAIIDGEVMINGGNCLTMALDMTKWRNKNRQKLIELLGYPLDEMWREYERTGIKYIHVPEDASMVLKFRTDLRDAVIPPLLPYLPTLANLNDLSDIQSTADELSFYKMIYLPLKTMNGQKSSDEWEITPDLAIDYFKILADDAIPSGVSSGVIPGDELKTIDFSDDVTENVNRVEKSQEQILGSAGGAGALLNAQKAVNNTALINAALKAESAYVLNSVLPQINAWVNLQLYLNVSNPCSVECLPVTIYTKEDYRKAMIEAMEYSYSYRLAYGTLLDMSERDTMAMLIFEQDALGLHNIMTHPLTSSHTQSGVGEDVGRPQTPDDELSPSGERSRNQ